MQAKPTLFGYGLTTKAIAKKLGGGCTFFDDNATEKRIDAEGNSILPSALFDPENSHLEVTTPSLPPEHPLIKAAKNLQSEYDYFAPSMPFSIWISGTNGKTTTTQMLTHLLSKRGALSGGNIGTPLAELDTKAPIWVLESSSFTLHHTQIASPNIYLLLPITPDHLDWHGTPEAYAQDKLRPLRTMKEGELALIPKGLAIPKTDAYVVEYDSNAFIAEYFNLDSTKLRFKAAFLQDALLALAVTKVLFDESDYETMNRFTLDAHRQEECKDAQGRVWVNDSKATNMDASIQAIKTYADQEIHLIAGGDDKGVNLEALFQSMQGIAITLYAIGKNVDTLASLAEKYHIPVEKTHTLQEAVSRIDTRLKPDAVALLSPAAASFDQFKSYKHRGETFMQLIKNLKN